MVRAALQVPDFVFSPEDGMILEMGGNLRLRNLVNKYRMHSINKINRILTWLAGSVVFTLALIFPLFYFIMSYQYAAGSLDAEAEGNARIISQIISNNPSMWQFEQLRIGEYLSRRPRQGEEEIRRVLDLKGGLVAESVDVVPGPLLKRATMLYDSGVAVGSIEIQRSLRPLFLRTGLIIVVVLPLVAWIFYMLRVIPLRAILRSEQELTNERDTAQKYLDVAGVMLLALDAGQKVILINKKGCEIMGGAEHEFLGKSWFDQYVPENLREAAKAEFSRLMKKGEEPGAPFENPVLTLGGKEKIMMWRNIVLRDAEGKAIGMLSSGEDITERKNLEVQLRHSQKMEAVGLLAGGIAHDFNNVLAVIVGYGSLLQMKMPGDAPLRHHVDQILQAAERAARMVKNLLAFSRKQVIEPKPVQANDIVTGVEKLLSRLLREDIELRITLSNEPMTIMADSGQLEQALMNLATNARDAMPNGGVFLIRTDRVMLDREFVSSHGYGAEGAFARISVSDTGIGMPESIQQKIFDPFFTTKEVGKGTGLGLAMAYGLIKQHNGYINVYSELGKGTTFKIYIPLAETRDHAAIRQHAITSKGGTETLLIAEDEANVRKMMVSVLQNAGYTVIETGDGQEAVQVFSDRRAEIKLAILDVIMPKKNGRVVFEEIRAMQADIKVLFMSGYTADIMKEQISPGIEAPFLSKPASANELLLKVREILDR